MNESPVFTGRIFNIQKFSVHDGPGVRDTVFMKGCPLRCVWCSNPESQSARPQIGWRDKKCIGCNVCLSVCPSHALSKDARGRLHRDASLCTLCMECSKKCYAKAMHVYGEELTVDEAYQRVRDKPLAWRTDGGVTVSGGEPLMQAEFVAVFLERFRRLSIHTAIETTLYAPFGKVALVAAHCSLIYADMKFFSSPKHRKYTGVDNALIKENFLRLKEEFPRVKLIARTPVIPGINDDMEELGAIADFLKKVPGLDDYELLPFHAFGAPKYEQLGMRYEVADLKGQDKDQIAALNDELRERMGLVVRAQEFVREKTH